MKNPFRRKRAAQSSDKPIQTPPTVEEPAPQAEELPKAAAPAEDTTPDDGFTEWRRTQVRGGIERRERNDIFEGYGVFGATADGKPAFRYYHRYPEHEKDFSLSYSRELSFEEFNSRLLSELDKGDIKPDAYDDCIRRAEELTGLPCAEGAEAWLSDAEADVIQAFCDGMDNLTDKEYLRGRGDLRCACRSAVGDEELQLWFRKPLRHDALDTEVAGVSRTEIYGYDIENLWIMGVYNRLRERCQKCRILLLTSEWSVSRETVCLMAAEGFDGVEGTLLLAIGDAAAFSRFGFYSLDFARR